MHVLVIPSWHDGMQVSNESLAAMLAGDSARASRTVADLEDMRQYVEGEGDVDSSRFLRVLQACALPSCMGCSGGMPSVMVYSSRWWCRWWC